ncbi:sugar ABC transporter substrate-binding protein [Rhodococcus opacus]|uniref:Sugar ABC transporter substrate-binding protein n=1 Tax=Rhodococcus opacus TaxID=37919 RepID=A0A2S8IP89_RHOOP|nr:sugar ABC transporter substrate-binding protein [Rhodococcus opacus]
MFKRAALVGAIAIVFGTVGCGSDGGGTSSGPGDSESARAFLAHAEQVAKAASGEIPLTVPTSGPPAVKDKTIVTIPCSAAAQGCKFAVDQFAEAAHAIGWKTIMIDPAGDPAKMADAVNRAVSMKADGIFTVAIDSSTIQAPLKAAGDAGLETICFSCIDEPELLVDELPAATQHERDGYALAAQAFIDGGANLKAILLQDSEFGNTIRRQQGVVKFIDECKAAGASCELVGQQNFLVQDISTSLPKQTVALLRKNPGWNALFAPYDAPLTFVLPELRSAGLVQDGQRAYGFDPIDLNVKWIRDGDVEAGTVASPYKWIAYAGVDQFNRVFAGEQPVDQGVKDKLVIKSNAPGEGETYLGDSDPATAFTQLWGVS